MLGELEGTSDHAGMGMDHVYKRLHVCYSMNDWHYRRGMIVKSQGEGTAEVGNLQHPVCQEYLLLRQLLLY